MWQLCVWQLFPTEHTLALRCAWPREDDLDSFTQYVSRVVYCTLAQKEAYPPHPHVISIDVCGVKTIELNLSQAQVEQLVNNGRLAASQTGLDGQAELENEINKVFDVFDGTIEFAVSNVNAAEGEIGGVFVSSQASDTDLGSKTPKKVLSKGIFYGRIEKQ